MIQFTFWLTVCVTLATVLIRDSPIPMNGLEGNNVAYVQDYIVQPIVQKRTERIWIKDERKPLLHIGVEDGKMMLFSPSKVLTDKLGNIYVFDFYDRSVKRFAPNGRFTLKYGYGKGKGPGEFSNPTDFDIADDGSIWVADPINGYLTIFHENGTVKNTIRCSNETPMRIIALKDGSFIVRPTQADFLFSRYNDKGNLVERFGNYFHRQSQLEIALDGLFAKGTGSIFVHCFYRVGLYAVYEGTSNKPRFVAQTINYNGLPAIIRREVGDSRITKIDPQSPWATLSASIVNGEVHLLVGSDRIPDRSIFDVYDLASGQYRYSYDLPSDVRFAHVTKDRIFATRDTIVTVWSR